MTPSLFREDPKGVSFQVLVQAKAQANQVVGEQAGSFKVRIAAPPVQGKANRECIKFLAEIFGLPKERLKIQQGERGRKKTIRVLNVSAQALEASLEKCLKRTKGITKG